MTRARPLLLVLGAVVLVGAVVLAVRGAVADAEPLTTGLADDPRGGCPPTPNCVSTLATVPQHAIDVLTCDADAATVRATVDEPDLRQQLLVIVQQRTADWSQQILEPEGASGTTTPISRNRQPQTPRPGTPSIDEITGMPPGAWGPSM